MVDEFRKVMWALLCWAVVMCAWTGGTLAQVADCSVGPREHDCNNNDIRDFCDVFGGTSADVNSNAVPDECDQCLLDDDCDDGIRCTLDQCVNGACQNTLFPACMNRDLDDDDDGVPDEADRCPGTPAAELADFEGCSRSQGGAFSDPGEINVPVGDRRPDSDGDSVGDEFDQCPDTPADVEAVDAGGCPIDRGAPSPTTGDGDDGDGSTAVACGAMGLLTFLSLASGLLFLRFARHDCGGLR